MDNCKLNDVYYRESPSPDEGDIPEKPVVDHAVDAFSGKASKDLILGTVSGWLAGYMFFKLGKVAAFGLGARPPQLVPTSQSSSIQPPPSILQPSTQPPSILQPTEPTNIPEKPPPPPPDLISKPSEPFKAEDPNLFLEKPFIPQNPVPHSPKISPSSIPNPSPSVTTTKKMESGYPGYGGYIYSLPGYSAFQPISYPGIMQPNHGPIQTESSNTPDFMPFPIRPKENKEEKLAETNINVIESQLKFEVPKKDSPKTETETVRDITKVVPKVEGQQGDTQNIATKQNEAQTDVSKIVPEFIVSKLAVPQTEVSNIVPKYDTPKSVVHTAPQFEPSKHLLTKLEEQKLNVPKSNAPNFIKPDVPKFDAIKQDVTKLDLIKCDRPTAEVPKCEMPKHEVQKLDVQNKDILQFNTSRNEIAKPDIKKPDLPKLDSSEIKKADFPKFEAPKFDIPPQTDFEEQFTPEIIPTVPVVDANKNNESKVNITSLAQGSGATVTISSQLANKDMKKKVAERFSLKTSIPISKIDMKCVSNQTESAVQNPVVKKSPAPFNPAFNTSNVEPSKTEIKVQTQKVERPTKIEIQSNVIIKKARMDSDLKVSVEHKPVPSPLPATVPLPVSTNMNVPMSMAMTVPMSASMTVPVQQMPASIPNHSMNDSINALLNAAEAISKSENMFKKPEPKQDGIREIKDPPTFTQPVQTTRAMFNPINLEPGKVSFVTKPQETAFADSKNPILFIQNKTNIPNKMLLAIQQQNPQVILQRTNFDPKNLQAPSRLSSQGKKSNEENNPMTSKVVALKRMHPDTCDMNDFENLITENQIYGNKIVVKEKSQGTQQEQDLKRNVVLQPNFLYLSHVPLSGMVIKNNPRINPNPIPNPSEITKVQTIPLNTAPPSTNENKTTSEAGTMTSMNDVKTKAVKQPITVSKEIHVLKPNSNVVISNNNKSDFVFQTQQKVIMNPQILYKVPVAVEKDKMVNQATLSNNETPKVIPQVIKDNKIVELKNEKLYIACVDSKSQQPKILITNIRDQIHKIEDVSALDMYERRKRLKRLKYLTNKEPSNSITKQEVNTKKVLERVVESRAILTPNKIKDEVLKEFERSKAPMDQDSSDSDSEYDNDEELLRYNTIIEKYGIPKENHIEKAEFLANFRLATQEVYKEKELDREERILRRDKVASAYIAAGRLDRLTNDDSVQKEPPPPRQSCQAKETESTRGKVDVARDTDGLPKQSFLYNLSLLPVTKQYRDGYERIWHEIMKERKRRNGLLESGSVVRNVNIDLDTNGQLKLLTEIKKSVTDNNNFIKKRLDSTDNNPNETESIKSLAEKSFSELDRVTKMADRSVKIITGQDTRKRDLNPGFDSENIQKQHVNIQQPFQNYPHINIPNISKIISLKTEQFIEECTPTDLTSTQATSMDEPQNSAAGVNDRADGSRTDKVHDFGCQVDDFSCLGIEDMIKKYREYDAARKKEIAYLHRRNTALRVTLAKTRRSTGHHTELARALLAERNALAAEEAREIEKIEKLWTAVRTVMNCQAEQERKKYSF